MKTILVTAYAINPYKGSEDGTGWNYVRQVARFNKVIAITRENNLTDIQRYVEEHQLDVSNIEFKGYDLPYWARWWRPRPRPRPLRPGAGRCRSTCRRGGER